MTCFVYEFDDSELIDDFAIDYSDLYESAESYILQLEAAPQDSDLLNGLFRAIHTVKGNCSLLQLDPLVSLFQELESVLDLVRQQQLMYEPLIGDLTLLILDRCSGFIENLQQDVKVDYDGPLFADVADNLRIVSLAPRAEKTKLLSNVLALLDPDTEAVEQVSRGDALLRKYGIGVSNDLLFTIKLARQTQDRASFWSGRIDRIVAWLMLLNDAVDRRQSPEQLLVAVCLHDISMAMLPSAVITKDTRLNEEELILVRGHVEVASQLASCFPAWSEAQRILQHHQEHYNGTGYPQGLRGDQICPGAQMLAIVHTFEAITHGYSKDLSRKRPLMRAIMELNRFSGAQFNPEYVQKFMVLTRENDQSWM